MNADLAREELGQQGIPEGSEDSRFLHIDDSPPIQRTDGGIESQQQGPRRNEDRQRTKGLFANLRKG